MPVGIEYFGEMGVVGVLAHEYGHALQWMAGLVDIDTDVLVREQQADCFAGVYLRWVAAGDSPRFTLSTGDGLNRVLAGVIYLRDPVAPMEMPDAHGSALDRISAFQMGFTEAPTSAPPSTSPRSRSAKAICPSSSPMTSTANRCWTARSTRARCRS